MRKFVSLLLQFLPEAIRRRCTLSVSQSVTSTNPTNGDTTTTTVTVSVALEDPETPKSDIRCPLCNKFLLLDHLYYVVPLEDSMVIPLDAFVACFMDDPNHVVLTCDRPDCLGRPKHPPIIAIGKQSALLGIERPLSISGNLKSRTQRIQLPLERVSASAE